MLLVENGQVTELFSGFFYGISWDYKQIYMMSQAGPFIHIWTGENKISDCKLVPFPHRIDDTHQILWYEGILYVTHTGRNRIETWDGERSRIYEWSQDRGQGTEHINSIWCDGYLFYVCEHRYGKLPAKIRIFNLNFELKNTIEFYDLNTDHACGIHNVYVENEILYTLSINHLIRRNLITGETKSSDIRSHKDIGYLRSFARSRDKFYIGESAVAVREDRRKGDSSVLILDNDLQIVDIIRLKDTGQIHEIRLLKNDRAHNNLDCPIIWERKI